MNSDSVVGMKKLVWYLMFSAGMVGVLVVFINEAFHGL